MTSGGYRAPANPAPVSGPGALSKRTDVQTPMALPDPAYGEGQEFIDIQRGAPLAGASSAPLPLGFDAPDDMPDVPVTAGAPIGPGEMGLRPRPVTRSTVTQSLQAKATASRNAYMQYLANLSESLGL
jgi:hypothetical protein